MKTHLKGRNTVLRSRTPALVRQEFFGFLLAHFAVRSLIHEAALKAERDPDRLSFLHAVRSPAQNPPSTCNNRHDNKCALERPVT